MKQPNEDPLIPESLAANGIQGAKATASGYCETQDSAQDAAALAVIDAACGQLDRYALATDAPVPGTVEAADLWDAAREALQRGRTMTGPKLTGSRCQCCVCGEYFGNVRGFDRHRIGAVGEPGRRCLSNAEMMRNGWRRNARGFLLKPATGNAQARVQGLRAPPPATCVAGSRDEGA